MGRRPPPSDDAARLRRRAEARLTARAAGGHPPRTAADLQRLLHELQVHQIELELQNEELRQARDQVEAGLARYTDLYDFAPVGYVTLDRAGAIRQANLACARLLGVERSKVLARRLAQFVAAPARPAFEACLQQALGSRGATATCEVTLADSGTPPRWVRIEAEASAEGQECRAIVVDITERTRAEASVRASEARLAGIVGSAMDAIISVDADQRIVLFNAAAERMFGCPAPEALGQPLDRFLPVHYRDRHRAHVRAFGATAVTTRPMGILGALSALRADGQEFPIEASISQVEVAGQRLFTIILRDVTEWKRAEGQRELLLRELNHRVKNTLAIVHGLARQSARSAASLEAFLASFEDRLLAVASAHDLLTQGQGTAVEVGDVVRTTLAPHQAGGVRIGVTGGPVRLAPKAALALSLALHELATNAIKYGALSVPEGRVEVTWRLADERTVELEWTERHGPPVRRPSHKGFGLRLLERGLRQELDATVRVEFRPTGVWCRVRFPASHGAEETANA
jgi:PAS domain S-box-containing protein